MTLMRMDSLAALLTSVAIFFGASLCHAGNNDVWFSRYATFNPQEFAGCSNACGIVQPNEVYFQKMVGDLGQVFAPRLANPAETLGEAGFAVNMMTSWSLIPSSEPHWQDGIEDRSPPGSLFTGHLQVRKGLPLSFEIAGEMGYLFDSEMFTLGSHLKWALNEGFYYFPDVAVRGVVNTLAGSPEINLLSVGADVSMSKAFGISGVVSVVPYLGYQMLFAIGSSRLLNAYPQDPRPPQFDDMGTGQDVTTFSPEYVFSQHTDQLNRFFVGTRLNVWILNFVVEGVFADISQFTFAGGVDF
jgi:hypothetical protein